MPGNKWSISRERGHQKKTGPDKGQMDIHECLHRPVVPKVIPSPNVDDRAAHLPRKKSVPIESTSSASQGNRDVKRVGSIAKKRVLVEWSQRKKT
jgi:hypothetical protein